MRLITVTEEVKGGAAVRGGDRWVDLIHETLIRSKGVDAAAEPQPYWPTLWTYIEKNKERAAWLKRLQADTRQWLEKQKNVSYQWSHERVREAIDVLRPIVGELSPEERAFLGPVDPEAMRAELERPETTHRRRLLIGERLAALGDPRPAVGIEADGTPEIDWCAVSGGEVTISMLSNPDNPYSEVMGTYRKIIETFRIARFPITVAQYRAFIEAQDGWCDPAWWEDNLYRDPDSDYYEWRLDNNHPAVYVSWFDAVAFCRWLSRRLRLTIRLPDEWEWQQAATGGDDRNVFPWGAEWDLKRELHRANTFESRLGGVTAVGLYPAGASPQGVLDMAGTVWEWCLNKFEAPRVTRSDARDFDSRTLRGGSWDHGRDDARSTGRNRSGPSFQRRIIGFRVVCSSPSSVTDH